MQIKKIQILKIYLFNKTKPIILINKANITIEFSCNYISHKKRRRIWSRGQMSKVHTISGSWQYMSHGLKVMHQYGIYMYHEPRDLVFFSNVGHDLIFDFQRQVQHEETKNPG